MISATAVPTIEDEVKALPMPLVPCDAQSNTSADLAVEAPPILSELTVEGDHYLPSDGETDPLALAVEVGDNVPPSLSETPQSLDASGARDCSLGEPFADSPDANRLTEHEKLLLRECEATIEKSFASFIEVGCALKAIKGEGGTGLYREKYKTFEDYVSKEWDKGPRWAYQLIDAAEVVECLRKCAQLPRNEAQARELKAIPPARRAKVWQELLDKYGDNRMTAKQIEEHIAQRRRGKARLEGTPFADQMIRPGVQQPSRSAEPEQSDVDTPGPPTVGDENEECVELREGSTAKFFYDLTGYLDDACCFLIDPDKDELDDLNATFDGWQEELRYQATRLLKLLSAFDSTTEQNIATIE